MFPKHSPTRAKYEVVSTASAFNSPPLAADAFHPQRRNYTTTPRRIATAPCGVIYFARGIFQEQNRRKRTQASHAVRCLRIWAVQRTMSRMPSQLAENLGRHSRRLPIPCRLVRRLVFDLRHLRGVSDITPHARKRPLARSALRGYKVTGRGNKTRHGPFPSLLGGFPAPRPSPQRLDGLGGVADDVVLDCVV